MQLEDKQSNIFLAIGRKLWPRTIRVKLFLLAVFSLTAFFIWKNLPQNISAQKNDSTSPKVAGESDEKWFMPGPISMDDMKKRGCVADGILSGYGGDTNEAVAMVKRSNCIYLHRALETWGSPPDFDKAAKIMQKINKPGMIYGMFLAEAMKKNGESDYVGEGKKFTFSTMCKNGSKGAWGEKTCKADLGSGEYRRYLQYTTHRAMDIGIQSFLFGQIYLQDNPAHSDMPRVLADMRSYAKERGMQIVIGAQTGTITDEKYLRMFDYIEGGVGMGDSGTIETGACWSRLPSCWGLLWNDQYAKKANNVFIHLDWSGLTYDDMSSFARMDKATREKTLNKFYSYFTSKDMGFMMPLMATLNEKNGGCYGPKKGFYSASQNYSCQDENVINAIIGKSGK